MDTPTPGKLNLSAGQSRTHTALKAVTLVVREIWLGRNEVLHQHQDETDQKIYLMESAELCQYHSNPTLIQTSDQHYCRNITLTKLLHSRPSVRRRWLRRVKTACAAYLKDGTNQQQVTQYMVATPPTCNVSTRLANHPPENTPNRTRRHSNTTQQRMTAFFPGRPPDDHNNIQNPLPSQR